MKGRVIITPGFEIFPSPCDEYTRSKAKSDFESAKQRTIETRILDWRKEQAAKSKTDIKEIPRPDPSKFEPAGWAAIHWRSGYIVMDVAAWNKLTKRKRDKIMKFAMDSNINYGRPIA